MKVWLEFVGTLLNASMVRTKLFFWVAVKELKLSYYIGEALLSTIYTHYGTSNPVFLCPIKPDLSKPYYRAELRLRVFWRLFMPFQVELLLFFLIQGPCNDFASPRGGLVFTYIRWPRMEDDVLFRLGAGCCGKALSLINTVYEGQGMRPKSWCQMFSIYNSMERRA